MVLGNNCYCYKDECNQAEWERQGKTGKREYTVVQDFWIHKKLFGELQSVPVCPYCKEQMTVTANMGSDY